MSVSPEKSPQHQAAARARWGRRIVRLDQLPESTARAVLALVDAEERAQRREASAGTS